MQFGKIKVSEGWGVRRINNINDIKYLWMLQKETRVKNTSREEPLLRQFTIVKNPPN